MAFVVFSSLNDGSSGATVSTATKSSKADSNSSVGSNSQETSTISTPKIYVHIVGQVVHPGLYILQSGARLADAILAADGFTRFADQASVNLARALSDGEQIFVLKLGSNSGLLGGNSSGGSSQGHAAIINLNRSSETEIESLPGVGPTLAGRIIDWRIANGGFKSKADLQKVAGIGDKLFAQLKDLVTL